MIQLKGRSNTQYELCEEQAQRSELLRETMGFGEMGCVTLDAEERVVYQAVCMLKKKRLSALEHLHETLRLLHYLMVDDDVLQWACSHLEGGAFALHIAYEDDLFAFEFAVWNFETTMRVLQCTRIDHQFAAFPESREYMNCQVIRHYHVDTPEIFSMRMVTNQKLHVARRFMQSMPRSFVFGDTGDFLVLMATARYDAGMRFFLTQTDMAYTTKVEDTTWNVVTQYAAERRTDMLTLLLRHVRPKRSGDVPVFYAEESAAQFVGQNK